MTPRFIGNLNWAPQQHNTPDLWRLEEPYAQVITHWIPDNVPAVDIL